MAEQLRRERLRREMIDEIIGTARLLLEKDGPSAISVRAIARQVGVTTHTIWRLENDPAANPRLQTLRAVAKALGATMAELLDK